jgi:hypothetical protein
VWHARAVSAHVVDPGLHAAFQVIVGGVVVFLTGYLIGSS